MNDVLHAQPLVLLAALGIELVVDSVLTMIFIKVTCWLYNRLLSGTYDREGVFNVPVQFRDDMEIVQERPVVNFEMLDPYAVPPMSWGTAATISVLYNLVQSTVMGGLFYFLVMQTSQLGTPDPLRIGFMMMLVWLPLSYFSMAFLFTYFLPTEYQKSAVLTIVFSVVAIVLTSALMLAFGLFLPFFSVRLKK